MRDSIFDFAMSGNVVFMKKMLESGADVTDRDTRGLTPLMVTAGACANIECFDLLFEYGADIEEESESGWFPLLFAARYNPSAAVTSWFIEKGAKINARTRFGVTPLMAAGEHNPNPEVVRLLLNAGANAVLKCDDGKNALDYARKNKGAKELLDGIEQFAVTSEEFIVLVQEGIRENIVRRINAGANLEARNEHGSTSLMYAARKNPDPSIVRLLVQSGAPVNAVNMTGATALMFAAKSNPNPDVIIALLDVNADIRIKTNTGKTAYDLGKENPAIAGSPVLDLLKI